MKKILFAILMLSTLLSSCEKDTTETGPLPEVVDLEFSISATALVRGDEVTLEITVPQPAAVEGETPQTITSNEEFDIYLTALDKSGNDMSSLFVDLPEFITFLNGTTELSTVLRVSDSVEGENTITLRAFARGYSMASATKEMIIKDFYRTSVEVVDESEVPSSKFTEGDIIKFRASVEVPAQEQVVVTPSLEGDLSEYFDSSVTELPTITIEPGTTTGVSTGVMLYDDNLPSAAKKFDIKFSSPSLLHPLSQATELISITLEDNDIDLGPINTEEYVYESPDQIFASATNIFNAITSQWLIGATEPRHIVRGDAHPTPALADKWKLHNAVEFDFSTTPTTGVINSLWQANGANYKVPYLADGVSSVQNVNASTVAVDPSSKTGYLRLTASPKTATASDGFYLSSFYGCRYTPNTWRSQFARLTPGTRIEVRSRVRGMNAGISFVVEMKGRTTVPGAPGGSVPRVSVVKYASYADVGDADAAASENKAVIQGTHDGSSVGKVNIRPEINAPDDWNIFWFEWTDKNEVIFGINGEETRRLTKGDGQIPNWLFDEDYVAAIDSNGFELFIEAKINDGDAVKSGGLPEAGFYDRLNGITSANLDDPNTPRMEIDWIRFYKATDFNDDPSLAENKINGILPY